MASSLTSSALVSLAVSALTGIFTFAAGIRTAKNNADRGLLREHYKKLFEHFTDIKHWIVEARPRIWSEYKLIHDYYTPLVQGMKRDGSGNLLPKIFFDDLEKAETEALVAGGLFVKQVREGLGPAVSSLLEVNIQNPTSAISGRTYRQIHIGKIARDPNSILALPEDQAWGIGIETMFERGKTHQLYFYREKLVPGVSLENLVEQIAELAKNNAPLAEARSRLDMAARRVDAALSVLSRRISDPHPLYETLRQTVGEVFRRPT